MGRSRTGRDRIGRVGPGSVQRHEFREQPPASVPPEVDFHGRGAVRVGRHCSARVDVGGALGGGEGGGVGVGCGGVGGCCCGVGVGVPGVGGPSSCGVGGGGVGGGSSNAATTLVALNDLWKTGLTTEELAQLGLSLGADVPIFVHGKAAFAEGVGEQITYCEVPEKWYVVLKPNVSISTAVIFSDPDLPRQTPKKPLSQLLQEEYANDCEKVVRDHYSEVEELLNWLVKYAPARLTGTGACVFAEFDDEKSAQWVLEAKPQNCFGFVAKGLNLSPLHAMLQRTNVENLPDSSR